MEERPANEFSAAEAGRKGSAPADPPESRWTGMATWAPWALVAVHAAVVIAGTLRHEIWRDEAQSWLIAQVSSTPLDLFNWAPAEGHPVLWYLFVWVVSRFSENVMAMQLFHAAIAIGSGMLIALAMPRPLWQRGLLMFGYFFVFEYAVIARSYGLGVFLILVACALAGRRHRPAVMVAIGIVLLLAANTSVHGALVAAAVGAGLAVDWLLAGRRGDSRGGDAEAGGSLPARAPGWATLTAALLCAMGLLLCYVQIKHYPAGERGYRDLKPSGVMAGAIEEPTPLHEVISAGEPLVRGMLPVPPERSMTFWEKNIITHGLSVPAQQPFLALALIVAAALAVVMTVRRPAVAAVGWAGFGALTLFHYLGLLGSMRHMGHYFVIFVVCLWLWRVFPAVRDRGGRSVRRLDRLVARAGTVALGLLLVAHVAVGLMAVRHDLRLPFSTARLAAEAVEREFGPDTLVLVWGDVYGSAVAVYLGREIYHVNSQRYGGPVDWDARAHRDREANELEVSRDEMIARGVSRAALIRHEPIPEGMETPGLEVRSMGKIETAIAHHESFWLYDLRLAGQAVPQSPADGP